MASNPVVVPDVYFTAEDLAPYTGANGTPIYLSVMGIVYDVSAGVDFYGPNGSYQFLAGKEVSRILARMETNDLQANAGWSNLSEEHAKTLLEWKAKYDKKYVCVGRFVPDPEYEKRGMMFQ